MRLLVVVIGLVACGSSSRQGGRSSLRIWKKPAYTVQPSELGAPDVIARIPHRARLLRYGRAFPDPRGEPLSGGAGGDAARTEVPVLGESETQLLVVSDGDDARVSLWVDRAEVAVALADAVVFSDRNGHVADLNAGVWLDAGADIEVLGQDGTRREVRIVDDNVRASGWVVGTQLDQVWWSSGDDTLSPERWHVFAPQANRDPGPARTVEIGKGALLRSPGNGSVIAELATDERGTLLHTRQGWGLVELRRRRMLIRGYAPGESISDAAATENLSEMAGDGAYGISDTDRITIAAGTCLYNREAGQVIGVNLTARERYGHHHRTGEAWSSVYVNTPWGLALLAVHDVAGADDAAAAQWESCNDR